MADLAPGHRIKKRGKVNEVKEGVGIFPHRLYYQDSGVSFEAKDRNKTGPWERSRIRDQSTSRTLLGSLASDLLCSILTHWSLALSVP